MTPQQFTQIVGDAGVAKAWYEPMVKAMADFKINTPRRKAAFLAQVMHESAHLKRLQESLYYRDPERIARIFRRAFDLDRDKVVDPEEIEFAKGFVGQPQKLANRAYANRMGNGDEASGDGWKHRGMGPIQITGKDNQTACGKAIGLDLVSNPEKLMEPVGGSRGSAWFFATNGLNELADLGKFQAICGAVNVGDKNAPAKAIIGFDERVKLNAQYQKILGA